MSDGFLSIAVIFVTNILEVYKNSLLGGVAQKVKWGKTGQIH